MDFLGITVVIKMFTNVYTVKIALFVDQTFNQFFKSLKRLVVGSRGFGILGFTKVKHGGDTLDFDMFACAKVFKFLK